MVCDVHSKFLCSVMGCIVYISGTEHERKLLRLVTCNRLVIFGISKQQRIQFKNTNLTKSKRLRYVTLTGLIWVQCILAS